MASTIGVDVGGTKILGGVVDDDGRILATARRKTPAAAPGAVAEVITEVVAELRADYDDVQAVGIGAAGYVDETRSLVLFASNLAWRNEPLRDVVSAAVGLPVVVENDANAAAWGEFRFGAAKGQSHVVAVTVGTGVGGGIIIDSRLFRGRYGVGGEIGHIQLHPNGLLCGCGFRGCWEPYASGNALTRMARELVAAGGPAGRRIQELAGSKKVSGQHVTQAAQEGDRAAIGLLRQLGHNLGYGMAQLATLLDPGMFVIGGGVCAAGDLLLDPIKERLYETVTGRGYHPDAEVVLAELGNDAGLVGAADLALR